MSRRFSRRGRLLLPATVAGLAVAVALSGCTSDEPRAEPTTPAPTTAPPPPAAPARGACYDLDFGEAEAPTSDAAPVPCTGRHTSTTIHVGTIRPVVDGHLLAVDSDRVQEQVARRCRARLAGHLGGDEETRRLSRFAVVWFSPSLADTDRGALWFRCDVIALAGRDKLAPLPRRTRGLLDRDDVLDRFGTCGTSSPAGDRFRRVICSQRHSWRAQATIDLPTGTKYLGKAARADADSACRDVEAGLADNALKLEWSFEWPTREQWRAGQRYGLCWTPDSD